jgi:hypothetical protein
LPNEEVTLVLNAPMPVLCIGYTINLWSEENMGLNLSLAYLAVGESLGQNGVDVIYHRLL